MHAFGSFTFVFRRLIYPATSSPPQRLTSVDGSLSDALDVAVCVCVCVCASRVQEEVCGPYVWGHYDVLLLPPSFPYGGMENPCLTCTHATMSVLLDRYLTQWFVAAAWFLYLLQLLLLLLFVVAVIDFLISARSFALSLLHHNACCRCVRMCRL